MGLAISATLPAFAAQTTIGPFLDFKGIVAPGGTVGIVTQTQIDVVMLPWFHAVSSNGATFFVTGFAPQVPVTLCNPNTFIGIGQCSSWGFTDYANINSTQAVALKGLSFFSYDISDTSGRVRITTLYGIDRDPSGTSLSLGGIEANGPPLEITNEKIKGGFGDPQEYLPSFTSRVPLSQLSTVLGSGFDVSLIQGAPNATVQVFQTDVPVSAISAVPEPGTYALFAIGLAAIGMRKSLRSAAGKPGAA